MTKRIKRKVAYVVYYAADHEHIHAEFVLDENENPVRVVEQMMRDGEGYGMALEYRRAEKKVI